MSYGGENFSPPPSTRRFSTQTSHQTSASRPQPQPIIGPSPLQTPQYHAVTCLCPSCQLQDYPPNPYLTTSFRNTAPLHSGPTPPESWMAAQTDNWSTGDTSSSPAMMTYPDWRFLHGSDDDTTSSGVPGYAYTRPPISPVPSAPLYHGRGLTWPPSWTNSAQADNRRIGAIYPSSSLTPSSDLHFLYGAKPPTPEPVVHDAACNLCDFLIVGDRFRCLICPDFDTCGSCFSITSVQHPDHNFMKIHNPSDVAVSALRPLHAVYCDGCDSVIHGARYRCIHSDCPNFNLCEQCGAHPIPMHNSTHTMLKMESLRGSTIVCDGCNTTIYGVRYNCMHSDCPNFDLCEQCEAHLVSMHNSTHPMLRVEPPDVPRLASAPPGFYVPSASLAPSLPPFPSMPLHSSPVPWGPPTLPARAHMDERTSPPFPTIHSQTPFMYSDSDSDLSRSESPQGLPSLDADLSDDIRLYSLMTRTPFLSPSIGGTTQSPVSFNSSQKDWEEPETTRYASVSPSISAVLSPPLTPERELTWSASRTHSPQSVNESVGSILASSSVAMYADPDSRRNLNAGTMVDAAGSACSPPSYSAVPPEQQDIDHLNLDEGDPGSPRNVGAAKTSPACTYPSHSAALKQEDMDDRNLFADATYLDTGSPRSVGAAETSPASTSPSYLATPEQEEMDDRNLGEDVATHPSPGSPRSAGAAATSPLCTSPPYSAIPKQEDTDDPNLNEEVTTSQAPGSPRSVGAAAISFSCTSPPHSAVPQEEDEEDLTLNEKNDGPNSSRPRSIAGLGPLMNFNFTKSRINAGGDVASHNIINSTINAFDQETMSYIQYSKLPRAKNAPYNCADRPVRGPCADGTRIEFLDELSIWLCDTSAPRLGWISGMAGTGKSTIAYTLSEELQRVGAYGGSFFCSENDDDCTNARNILPTLAISLAQQLPSYAKALQGVLKNTPDAGHGHVKQQFKDLFVVPCQSLSTENARVIIIDALDECEDEEAVAALIAALAENVLPLKFVVTSEHDQTIMRAFKMRTIGKDYTPFLLQDVPEDVVSGDIRRYISESLVLMKEGRSEFEGRNEDWPPLNQVGVLTDRADRLFLYAATACRYVVKGLPIRERLKDITSDDFRLTDSGLDTEPIDSLYRGILKKAFKGRTGKEMARLKLVLSSIVSLRDSLSMVALSTLLDGVHIQSTLSDLQSVISVPQSNGGLVSAFHASFPEFLHVASRSLDFYMNPTESHLDLAKRCISYLQKNLHQNLCRLPQPVPNSDIQPDVIEKSIPNVMRYASVFFTSHYLLAIGEHALTDDNREIENAIWNFMIKHALNWVECLSILGQVPVVLRLLKVAGPRMTGKDTKKMQQHLADFSEFVSHNFDLISHSCLGIHEAFKARKKTRLDTRRA